MEDHDLVARYNYDAFVPEKFGPWLNFTWLAVAAVAWARLRLRDHTPAQVVVGVALGLIAAGGVFPLLR